MALQISHLHESDSTVTWGIRRQAARFAAVEFSPRMNAGDAEG